MLGHCISGHIHERRGAEGGGGGEGGVQRSLIIIYWYYGHELDKRATVSDQAIGILKSAKTAFCRDLRQGPLPPLLLSTEVLTRGRKL